MKPLLIIALILSWQMLNAQSNVFTTAENTKNPGILDAYDLSGNAIPTGKQADVKGSPMLSEQFINGTVRFANGKLYNGVLNLSLTENQLHFKKDNTEMLFAVEVKDFSLKLNENGKTTEAYFKSGYPSIGVNTGKSFYRVLSAGSKIELLKYEYKLAEEVYHYGGPSERVYGLREKLFVYDIATQKISEIGYGAKSIKKAFPSCAEIIDKIINEKGLNLKHEEDVIQLVDALNNQ